MKSAMQRNMYRNLAGLMIASAFALAGCGGGGGGGDHGGGGGLASGTFTRTFSPASNGGDQLPFGVAIFGDVTYQGLYTAAQVGGSGRIATLRFQNVLANAGPITCPNTTIRLGHSNAAALVGTFASNMNLGTPQVVLNNATVNVPAAATTWFDVPLTTPFDYNGVDNLVVQVDRTTTCSGGVVFGVNSTNFGASTRAYSAATDTTPGTAQNNTTTGALDNVMPWMQFVFAGGDNRVELGGTNIAANSNSFPWTANKRTQHLYLASEINGSGPITGIAFQANLQNTVAATYTYTIRLGHTTLTQLGTAFDGNFSGSPTTVANAVTGFTIPAGIVPGDWFWVPIPDGIFTYNGTDNLVVEVSVPAGTAANIVRFFPGVIGRRLYNNSNAAAATGTVDDDAYHIALRFNGGQVVVMPRGTDQFDDYPFGTGLGASSKKQFLYRMAELGTGGSITGVACRLDQGTAGTTLATSYANFQVVLGHTTSDTLGATFATNMTDATTGFSGTYALAAGLRAGDWIEMPLSTPFTYDPTKNLVVQLSGDGGANFYNCDAKGPDATLYLNRHMSAADRTAAGSAPNSFLSELKLTISK